MEYILIFAQDGDKTTDEVIHWIKLLSDDKIKIFRINDSDKIEVININVRNGVKTDFSICINQHPVIQSSEISAFWFRRGELSYQHVIATIPLTNNGSYKTLYENIDKYYLNEWQHIINYIHFLLKNNGVASINSYFDNDTNKLINVEQAKKLGFKVPHSLISNDINEIRIFLTQHKKVIVKPIRFPGNYFFTDQENVSFAQHTNLFTVEDLDNLFKKYSKFQPTLFQEYIEKEFEVRSFYLKGIFYSMAIFSQSNEQTKIDFRNWKEGINPNRSVPFALPKEIELKLSILMRKLDYDTGSIDLIFDGNDYTFLEINTVGQLDWLSKNCNYYIEKEIAKELIKYHYANTGK